MSKSCPIDQISWTKKLRDASGRTYIGLEFLEQQRKQWWFNPLNTNSMRLSREGVNYAINHAKIYHYLHNLDNKIMPKTLLQLEKTLEYPYYISTLTKLIVFDERTSLTLTLYNNDLQTYLNNVQKFS
jgi:hypothetical protein